MFLTLLVQLASSLRVFELIAFIRNLLMSNPNLSTPQEPLNNQSNTQTTTNDQNIINQPTLNHLEKHTDDHHNLVSSADNNLFSRVNNTYHTLSQYIKIHIP